jgi:hypothetical protein
MSRRVFLSTLVSAYCGLGAVARADLGSFNRKRVDRNLEHFAGPVADSGYLDQPAAAVDDDLRSPQMPYGPQPGDIMFSRSKYWIYRAGHRLAGAGEPSHSALVWQRPDGALAVMEAGPFDVPIIRSMDLVPHLTAYHGRGHVWIRRRETPLTVDETSRLAEFCLKQENKPFARLRLMGQITPFRCRGHFRTDFLGRVNGPDRCSYYCSELVTEALVFTGLMDANTARPCATYPCDLFFDDSPIPYLKQHLNLRSSWRLPQRWRPHLA